MRIRIRAKPRAKTGSVTKEGDVFVVAVREPPENGRANRAIEEALAEHFKVPSVYVRIVSGRTSREKTAEIYMKER